MDTKIILKKISDLLAERHWTINELTTQAGLSSGVIYEWYSHKKKPSLQAIEEICKAFGITLSAFFAVTPEEKLTLKQSELLAIGKILNEDRLDILLSLARQLDELPGV